ncbi:hypothetical protein N9T35_00530 [bacterium]|nr:hypothetical protein [bacterium]
MKLFSAISSAVVIGASLLTGSPVRASGQWPTRGFYPPRAVASSTRSAIPQFPASIPEFYRVPGRDFWNNPVSERGQVRTFGDGEWQSIHEFPNTMNGCHNGVFLLRWRSSSGPVLSAVGTSFSADFRASKPSSYGYMYGNNCLKPLFKSLRSSSINNVMYQVVFFKAGV